MVTKTRNLLLILLLPAILDFAVVSCCNCKETQYQNYSHCSISLQNLSDTGKQPEITESDSISKNAFGLNLIIERNKKVCTNSNRSLFGSDAFAQDCICPPELEYVAHDSVEAITVITLQDYTDKYFKGDTLDNIIGVYSKSTLSSISEFQSSYQSTLYTWEGNLNLKLLFMEPPKNDGSYQFKVAIQLSDGRLLEATSQIVYLF